MILGVFIEFVETKIAIGLLKNHCDLIITVEFDLSQNGQYISDILLIYLQYFTDISPIFTDIFPEISTHARVRYSIEISPKYRELMIFW